MYLLPQTSPHQSNDALFAECRPQCLNRDIAGGHRSCERIGIARIPLLAPSQGGVAERPKKCREASADREAGVVFRLRTKGKHPGCVRLRWLRSIFLMTQPSPPCGDARRGITHHCHSFTSSQSAATVARYGFFVIRDSAGVVIAARKPFFNEAIQDDEQIAGAHLLDLPLRLAALSIGP